MPDALGARRSAPSTISVVCPRETAKRATDMTVRSLSPAELGAKHVSGKTQRQPELVVVIDCEEEFDWDRPVRGTPCTVRSTAEISPLQDVMRNYGVCPTYVVDYKVVDDEAAWRPLLAWRDRGECCVGAHLHPWVTPPFGEEASIINSFQANLPPALERAKIETLVALLEQRFGERPTIFRAGRFGIGSATASMLVDLGFEIDVSVMPHYSYLEQGGRDFRTAPMSPFWLGPGQSLLEIPVTAGFTGIAWRAGPCVQRLVDTRLAETVRLGGLLSRCFVLSRLRLTPEGMRLDEVKGLTRALLRRGQRVFNLTLHSTSMVLGGNPYVRSEVDRQRLVAWMDAFLGFFIHELGGVPATPHEFLTHARAARSASLGRPGATMAAQTVAGR